MPVKTSGDAPFTFIYRQDLRGLPGTVVDHEANLHGGFAVDPRPETGHLYYGMPGCGILRVEPDLARQELVSLPESLRPLNFHSAKIGLSGGSWRLFLPANNDALVAVVSLEGSLDYVLTRPEFEQYQDRAVTFAPTDTLLVGQQLFVADGYGANYITTAEGSGHKWAHIFGGKTESPTENGKFGTAHGLRAHPDNPRQIMVADRPNARIQAHDLDGNFIATHPLPPGAWPCGIDYHREAGRWLAVVGSLVDPIQDRPAPIYIVDAGADEVLSTIRPKEDLGIAPAQHIHNVVWHTHNGRLFLVCQSWNPGYYFVLERI